MAIGFDSKPNLSCRQFSQCSGDTLYLGGHTVVCDTGTIDSHNGYDVCGKTNFNIGSGNNSLQIGYGAISSGNSSIAIGASSCVQFACSIVMGYNNKSYAACSNIFGGSSNTLGASNSGSTLLGVNNCTNLNNFNCYVIVPNLAILNSPGGSGNYLCWNSSTKKLGLVTGGITGATSLGSGNAVYSGASNYNLKFKSICAGTNVSISNNANNITICSGTLGWSNLANGSTVAGCGTPASASTICQNTIYGVCAGNAITTGCGNIADGFTALAKNTSGCDNVAVGKAALYNNMTGNYNIANGCQALFNNLSGGYNIGIGSNSLVNNKIGNCNVAFGTQALAGNISGNSNTAIGSNAGISNVTGSSSVFIGTCAGFGETKSNRLHIGHGNSSLIYGEFDNQKLCFRGKLYASGLTNASTGNAIFYNTSTKELTYATAPSGSGGVTGATNLGSGNGTIYTSLNNNNIQLKTLSGGTNVTLTCNGSYIAINATGGGNGITGATSLGSGNAVYSGASNCNLKFKSICAGSGVAISNNANNITICSTTLSGATSLGNGCAICGGITNHNLCLKSISGGSGISMSSTANQITVCTNFGWSNLGNGSTIVGCGTCSSGTVLTGNTFYGVQAGQNITPSTGCYNNAFGYNALRSVTTGCHNVGIGSCALYSNGAACDNIGVGTATLFYNTSGCNNIALGYRALFCNTSGCGNIANGCQALCCNSSGNNNIANGIATLGCNSTGSNNIANGYCALGNNTSGNFNTANGQLALLHNTTGLYNIATGYRPLWGNTTGNDNIGYGFAPLYCNTTGCNNIALGCWTNYFSDSGCHNISTGAWALYCNVSGCHNIAMGCCAGYCATGSSNIFIGNRAGATQKGSNKLYIASGNTTLIYGEFDNKIVCVNNKLITCKLQVLSGASSGYVLTSDASGNATWQAGGGGSSSVTGATNLGTGNGTIYTSLNNKNLQFKTLSGGTNVTLTCNGNYIAINAPSAAGASWTGSTANGVGTYASSSKICSNPNMTFNGSSLSVTGNILASTYMCSPIITGSTRVCSPIICGTSCVQSPIVCGTTCVTTPIVLASTYICSPIITGSTRICSPIVCATTCSSSPLHCGACGYFSTAVCSPIITGSTKVCSPIVCGTSCISTALLCSTGQVKGTIITGSTCVCSPNIYATTSFYEGGTALNAKYALKTNAITGATNLGTGNGRIFTSVSGNKNQFKTLSGGTNVTLTCNANYVAINATGGGGSGNALTGATSLGAGSSICGGITNHNLCLKSLSAGTNICLTSSASVVKPSVCLVSACDKKMLYDNAGVIGYTGMKYDPSLNQVYLGGVASGDTCMSFTTHASYGDFTNCCAISGLNVDTGNTLWSGNCTTFAIGYYSDPIGQGYGSYLCINKLYAACGYDSQGTDISLQLHLCADDLLLTNVTGQSSIKITNTDIVLDSHGAVSIVTGGIRPKHDSDANMPNDTIYYSTTSSKLVYKDSGGVVHALY